MKGDQQRDKIVQLLDKIVSNDTTPSASVSISDGNDAALGSKADSVATNSTSSWSVIALLKWIGSLLKSKPNLPFGADYLIQSNADGNGNYQTIVYKSGGSAGSTVKTISLTYDASSNVLTYTES